MSESRKVKKDLKEHEQRVEQIEKCEIDSRLKQKDTKEKNCEN